jgi:hypothetical protein
MPNGDSVRSTHTCHLHLPGLPPSATNAHVFPGLADHALCDNGCKAIFTATEVTIWNNNKPIMKGPRDHNGLWRINIEEPPKTPQENLATNSTTVADTMKFLHACLFSPVPSTLLKAI